MSTTPSEPWPPIVVTLARASRVTMLTFGGQQSWEAKAGERFPCHRIVEDNGSYVVVMSGLNAYVFEKSAVTVETLP